MSVSRDLIRAGQSLTPGNLVALFILDLAPLGVNQQFCFTSSVDRNRGVLVWRGTQFTPTDVRAEGFEFTSQGALPQPTISITNAKRVMSSAAILYNDLVGAQLTRIRVYEQFLDNGALAGQEGGAYPADIYNFEQKLSHNKKIIKFRLAASIDQEGRKIPSRVIIRDVCPWRYRRWDANAGAFDYSRVKCPYNGNQAYDRFGQPTTPDKDEPGRHLNDCCRVRFGDAAELPFGGFPGVTRTRV